MVVAENVGPARHLVVSASGDIYVAIRNQPDAPGGIVALRDTNGDGRVDVRERFAESGGTGIAIYNGHLYLSRDDAVVRFPLKAGQLLPAGPMEMVVSGFPQQRVHPTKTLTFDNQGGLYVNIGNPSNACTEPDQTKSNGLNPCTHQERGGGVWRFDANRTGQVHGKDGQRYSSGLRQANAMRWHPTANALYLAQHGRNGLNRWQEYFTEDTERGDAGRGAAAHRPGRQPWLPLLLLRPPAEQARARARSTAATARPWGTARSIRCRSPRSPRTGRRTTCSSTTGRSSARSIAAAPSSPSTGPEAARRCRRAAITSSSSRCATARRRATTRSSRTASPASRRSRRARKRSRGRWDWPKGRMVRCMSSIPSNGKIWRVINQRGGVS